MTLKTSAKCW